jgi:hypothetical protein
MHSPNLSAAYEFIQLQLDTGDLAPSFLSANLFLLNHEDSECGIGWPVGSSSIGISSLFFYCRICNLSLDHTNKPYKGPPNIMPITDDELIRLYQGRDNGCP